MPAASRSSPVACRPCALSKPPARSTCPRPGTTASVAARAVWTVPCPRLSACPPGSTWCATCNSSRSATSTSAAPGTNSSPASILAEPSSTPAGPVALPAGLRPWRARRARLRRGRSHAGRPRRLHRLGSRYSLAPLASRARPEPLPDPTLRPLPQSRLQGALARPAPSARRLPAPLRLPPSARGNLCLSRPTGHLAGGCQLAAHRRDRRAGPPRGRRHAGGEEGHLAVSAGAQLAHPVGPARAGRAAAGTGRGAWPPASGRTTSSGPHRWAMYA